MAKSRERERDRENDKKSKKRSRDETQLNSVEQHSGGKHSSSSSRRKHSKKHSRDHGSSGSSGSGSKHHHKRGSGSSGGKEREKEHKKSSSKKSKEKDSSSSRTRKRSKDSKDPGQDRQDIEVAIQISEKDYFTRATEFKVWLFQKKKQYFEDLTSAESHELFGKFVKDWNRGKLDAHFYEGRLPEELVARAKKTQHKWGFIKNLTDRDQMQLASANDSVHSSTEKVKGVTSNVPVAPAGSVGGINALMPPPRGGGTGKRPGNDRRREGDDDGDGGDESGRRTEKKRQRKQEKERHAVILDEIAPKETGRQEVADKRRAVGARTHAAAKEREDAADGLDMREADTMGGGDSFQEMLARSKGAKQRRQSAKEEKLQELAAKEEEKRTTFIAQMGLKVGQKITIQPRNDG